MYLEGRQRKSRYRPFVFLALIAISIFFMFPRGKTASNTDELRVGLADLNLPILETDYPLIPKIKNDPALPTVQTHAAILVDGATGTVLYAERAQTPVPIASTTKLMTAILTRKHLDLGQVVTITKEHTSVIGSDIALRPGEEITVGSLLAGLLLNSGNDTAMALAETAGGSVETFVEMMNREAAALGMTHTQYADPAGLDDTGRSTAADLAIIARAALKDPVIAELVSTPEKTVTSVDGMLVHQLKNSNRLVGEFDYSGAIGLKTGYTPDAGHCLVAGAEREGHQLIAVILKTDADTITASAIEARKLLDWGWQNTLWGA